MTKMEILEAINVMGMHFANTTNEKYAKTHTKDEVIRLYESCLDWFNRNKSAVKQIVQRGPGEKPGPDNRM